MSEKPEEEEKKEPGSDTARAPRDEAAKPADVVRSTRKVGRYESKRLEKELLVESVEPSDATPAQPVLTPPPEDADRGMPPSSSSESALVIDAAEPELEKKRDITATRSVPIRRPTTRKFVESMPPTIAETAPTTPSEVQLDPMGGGSSPEVVEPAVKRVLSSRLERSILATDMPEAFAPPAIEVSGLEASYGERAVLGGISFRVKKGEILVILGGSGSGKTTLLRHMIGLLRPARGSIKIGGQDITKLEGDELAIVLKSIGMLFQYSALFSGLSVGENVALPLREYTLLPDTAIRAIVRLKLALVGLPGIENLKPSELSGGMKKRVALARAVALDPDVVFFDEPGSGLDPIAAAELDALIKHLNRAFGTTMVIVSHDLENAFNVAHRMLVLDRGRIAALGTPNEVKATRDPWTRAFLSRQAATRDMPDEKFYARIAGAGRIAPGEKDQ